MRTATQRNSTVTITRITAILALVALAGAAPAAIIVSDYDAAAPDSPAFQRWDTGETDQGGFGINDSRVLAQTFDVISTFNIQSVVLPYRQGLESVRTWNLRIVEVGDIFSTSSLESAFDAPVSLLDETVTTQFPNQDGTTRLFQLDFSGASQIELAPRTGDAGYAVIITPPSGSDNLWNWMGQDGAQPRWMTSTDGGDSFSESSDRVFGIMITAVPEPATLALVGLGALSLTAHRRR